MKTRTLISITSIMVIVTLYMFGCTFTTTVTLEESYDVRIVNRSGEKVKVRWAGDSYRYLDDDCIICIPVDGGYYELEWEPASSRSYTRPKQIFRLEVNADIDIVFRDEPEVKVIVIDR